MGEGVNFPVKLPAAVGMVVKAGTEQQGEPGQHLRYGALC